MRAVIVPVAEADGGIHIVYAEVPHPVRDIECQFQVRIRFPEARQAGQEPAGRRPEVRQWMADSIAMLRQAYPCLDYCFSYTAEYANWREQDVSFMDFLEPHIWMTQAEVSDFDERMGFDLGKASFDPRMYEILARNAEPLYRKEPDYWKSCLKGGIDLLAEWSRQTDKPLITTERWALVAY